MYFSFLFFLVFCLYTIFSLRPMWNDNDKIRYSDFIGNCQQQQQHQLKTSNVQEDPCKVKSKVVADVAYCDRYWECVDGQPELYDCPNGLVFAGKYRGVTEGCDYPWRSDYCENKQPASKLIFRSDPRNNKIAEQKITFPFFLRNSGNQ